MKNDLRKRFKRILCLFLVLITTLSTLILPVSAASPPLPNGVYVFYAINKVTNMNVLYKKGAGALIGIDYADGEENELWVLERVGTTEYFTLRPWHQKNCYLSGVNGKGDGLTLEQGIPSSKYCQWKANYVDNGQVVITNRAYPSLAIDCTNGHIDTLANPYILWDKNGYDQAQSFYCVRVSESTTKYQPSNRVSPGQTTCAWGASADQSMVINSQYAKEAGASIVLDNLSSPVAEKNETVTLVPRGNNLYSMHFAHSPNTAIAASDIFTDSPITLKTFDANDPMCLWQVFQVGSGYSFRNAGNLLMLDNYCHGTRPGNLQISYSYTGGDPQVYFAKNVSTASSNSSNVSSAEAAVLQRLDAMMNGSYGNGVYKLNTRYNGTYASECCKGFAKDVFMMFGYNIGSTRSKPNNHQINYSSSKTNLVGSLTNLSGKSNSTVRTLFDNAKAGDFIQLRRSHGGSHSMIFLYNDANSVTVLEANVDGRNTITKNTYSWSVFRSKNAAVSVYTAKDYRIR